MADRSRWLALYVLCLGTLMIVLDGTIVNVALPSIQSDLHFTSSSLAWVVNAYLIAFGGLLLLSGRVGDLVGKKHVFMAGLTLFILASFACGAAQNQEMLVIARFIQGIGGAMTSAVTLGMIVTLFPEPREQAKAIGVFGFTASAGGSVGLLLGGILTQSINWHWIFFVNIPIGIATGIAAYRLIANDEGIGLGKGADLPGAVLITGALMLGVYTIVKPAAEDGWGASTTLLFAAGAVLLLVGFIVRESRAKHPLMPLRIFRSRNVSGANLVAALMVSGMFGMFFMGALYMQKVLGYDALQTGLAFLPVTLVSGVISLRLSQPIIMRFGAKYSLIPGLVLFAIGLAYFTQAPVGGDYWVHVFPVMMLLGLGGGIAFPALMTLAMSGATPEDAGLASGLINTMIQVGGALGLAVLATLAATRTTTLEGNGDSQLQALTGGYHLAFAIGTGLMLLALVVAVTVLEQTKMPPGHGPAEPAADETDSREPAPAGA